MQPIDLRSDTITQPTPAMRKAMAEAPVGDDVFGEDPTVNRLEKMAADHMGKEAALLVTSGTMGNLVSQMAHCQRGDEMILGDQAHIFYYEQGGSAAIGGIHPRIIPNHGDGTLSLDDMESAIRQDNIHFPRTRLIVLENTHNRCQGMPLGVGYLEQVADLAARYDLKIHMDGARIFNAAAALDLDVRQLAQYTDSITFCLSKGLAAPVGSVVCGSEEFVARARRVRKVLGGGMRQAGVLAAAGIVALEEMTGRLSEDHRCANQLAEGLAACSGIALDPDQVKTNIVFFDISHPNMTGQDLVDSLEPHGIKMLALGPRKIRAVTHYHITPQHIDQVLAVMPRVLL